MRPACHLGVNPQPRFGNHGILRAPFPNPATQQVKIEFEVASDADVMIEILDVAGRRIGMLAQGLYRSGLHITEWDRRGHGRASAVPGVYFVRLTVNGALIAQRPVTILGSE